MKHLKPETDYMSCDLGALSTEERAEAIAEVVGPIMLAGMSMTYSERQAAHVPAGDHYRGVSPDLIERGIVK